MSQATNYVEDRVLNAITSNGTINFATGGVTLGSGTYIGLFTGAPSDSGSGTEVSNSGTGYSRIQTGSAISSGGVQGKFGNVSGGSITNDAEIIWDISTADWGNISAVGLFDSATGGNLLVYGNLSSVVEMLNGDTFKIPLGGFTVSMD
jgi:hypothetical protein